MERLTAQDLSMLWPDDLGWPQDIGVLAILEGGVLRDSVGRVDIAPVRQAIAARARLIPRFRQRLFRPRRGLGWPLWVDVEDFDISDHVEVVPVPPPGDEAQLLLAVEQLRRRPFDQSRPLWRMWLLPGLHEGRIAFYLRVHHTIADGVAGVAALGALLDSVPTPIRRTAPSPVPSNRELFTDNVRRRWRELAHAASAIVRPVTTAKRLRASWPAMRETLASRPAPRTSLNRPIGTGRRIAVVRSRLDAVARTAHRHGATVNDVLMAAIAGGLRELLISRGEPVDVVLRAYVPVSLHRERPEQARGNQDGMMAVSLPIGVPDPILRLRLITRETTQRKRRTRPAGGTLLRNGVIQRAMLRLMKRQRWANVYVANVPGPPTPLRLAESQILELFPVVPLLGNVTVGVGALSYAGQFNITVVADRNSCPDLEVFTQGVRAALQSLAETPLMVPNR
jgi:WS/DGAT/MGAT family acyltransferase